MELAHRLPPVPVVSVELAARARTDAGLALPEDTADAASVTLLGTESQQGKKADPKTVHAFVYANGAAINKLGDEFAPVRWVGEIAP